jgi:hypothetical protein
MLPSSLERLIIFVHKETDQIERWFESGRREPDTPFFLYLLVSNIQSLATTRTSTCRFCFVVVARVCAFGYWSMMRPIPAKKQVELAKSESLDYCRFDDLYNQPWPILEAVVERGGNWGGILLAAAVADAEMLVPSMASRCKKYSLRFKMVLNCGGRCKYGDWESIVSRLVAINSWSPRSASSTILQ